MAQPTKKGGLLKKILIGIAVVILAFVVVVAMQPGDFRVTRSATIAAPADVVFAHVNDFHNWEAWSPWAKLDPAARNSFDGACVRERREILMRLETIKWAKAA